MPTVLVPAGRVRRWFENFETGHGAAAYDVAAGALVARALDGSTASAALPFDVPFDGAGSPEALAEAVPEAVSARGAWGVLLVRKGGFAVARLEGGHLVEHKVGQRHVQGRTKAGGQSQQRFARRRDNQARAAYEAAADHAARILGAGAPGAPLSALVCGGDHAAVEAVLRDHRLGEVAERRTSRWLTVSDPRRAVLDAAVADAMAVCIEVRNA